MGTIRSFALINCFLSTTPCLTAKQRGGCGVHTDEPAPHTVHLPHLEPLAHFISTNEFENLLKY